MYSGGGLRAREELLGAGQALDLHGAGRGALLEGADDPVAVRGDLRDVVLLVLEVDVVDPLDLDLVGLLGVPQKCTSKGI